MFKRILCFTTVLTMISLSLVSGDALMEGGNDLNSGIQVDAGLNNINPVRYRKKDVKRYKEWGSYKRLTNTVCTKNSTAELSISEDNTFSTIIGGVIEGLGINISSSITVKKGLKFTIPPNSCKYVAVRIQYDVESGIREYYDVQTGKIKGSNKYVVKKPISKQITLLDGRK